MSDRRLVDFVKYAWKEVEPMAEYVHNWHMDAICEHLEAVSRGEILKLVINIPPRFAKSLILSVFWPCWEWSTKPSMKWIYSSYAANLAIRDSIKCKDLIQSEFYQLLFGDVFQLTTEHQEKLVNNRHGSRFATSVGGGATGEGGDRIVTDDPHKIEEIESDIVRQAVIDWWDQTMNTRLNDPKRSARVIVMQRLHEDDLSGHVLAQKLGYVHLNLPMEYDSSRKKNFTGIKWFNPITRQVEPFADPRTREGELLFPARFGLREVNDLKATLGDYGYASKYQQVPVPKGGAMFHRAWFENTFRQFAPVEVQRVIRYWDKAGTSGGGAYTVGCRMSITSDKRVFVEDIARAQLADLDRENLIRQTAMFDRRIRPSTEIWIEQEPGSGGKDAAAATIRNLAGFYVQVERPSGDKLARASPYAAYCQAGNVHLIEAEWNEAYLRELEFFPRGKYKDQVDASAGAFNKLFRSGYAYNIGD